MGDSALLVRLGTDADPDLTERAHRLADAIEAARTETPGLGWPVPAHASVLVPFDPLGATAADVRRVVDRLLAEPTRPAAAASDEPAIEIPVRYGGSDGPDLESVAEAIGMSAADVVELHAGATFRVLFLGFAPGFAYLGGLPPDLRTARRSTPRERVPAGSVAIAGDHSAVYPLAMPGGWNLIGRTDACLFDPRADPPTPLAPGRIVRFVPDRARRG
jgi:KipI family sensor histidine kinase inhibitor